MSAPGQPEQPLASPPAGAIAAEDHDIVPPDPDADLHTSTTTFASMCPQQKMLYERCFQDWYVSEFLPMTPAGKQLPCPDLYENYRICVAEHMRELQLEEDVQEIVNVLEDEKKKQQPVPK